MSVHDSTEDEDAAIYGFERPLVLLKCPGCERRFSSEDARAQHVKAKKHG